MNWIQHEQLRGRGQTGSSRQLQHRGQQSTWRLRQTIQRAPPLLARSSLIQPRTRMQTPRLPSVYQTRIPRGRSWLNQHEPNADLYRAQFAKKLGLNHNILSGQTESQGRVTETPISNHSRIRHEKRSFMTSTPVAHRTETPLINWPIGKFSVPEDAVRGENEVSYCPTDSIMLREAVASCSKINVKPQHKSGVHINQTDYELTQPININYNQQRQVCSNHDELSWTLTTGRQSARSPREAAIATSWQTTPLDDRQHSASHNDSHRARQHNNSLQNFAAAAIIPTSGMNYSRCTPPEEVPLIYQQLSLTNEPLLNQTQISSYSSGCTSYFSVDSYESFKPTPHRNTSQASPFRLIPEIAPNISNFSHLYHNKTSIDNVEISHMFDSNHVEQQEAEDPLASAAYAQTRHCAELNRKLMHPSNVGECMYVNNQGLQTSSEKKPRINHTTYPKFDKADFALNYLKEVVDLFYEPENTHHTICSRLQSANFWQGMSNCRGDDRRLRSTSSLAVNAIETPFFSSSSNQLSQNETAKTTIPVVSNSTDTSYSKSRSNEVPISCNRSHVVENDGPQYCEQRVNGQHSISAPNMNHFHETVTQPCEDDQSRESQLTTTAHEVRSRNPGRDRGQPQSYNSNRSRQQSVSASKNPASTLRTSENRCSLDEKGRKHSTSTSAHFSQTFIAWGRSRRGFCTSTPYVSSHMVNSSSSRPRQRDTAHRTIVELEDQTTQTDQLCSRHTGTQTSPTRRNNIATRTSPTRSSVHQTETQTSPKRSSVHQTETQTSPKGSSVHQTETQTSPTRSSIHQTETQTSPTPSSVHQTETQTSPTRSSVHQTETQTSPTRSSIHQTETQISPTRHNTYQTETQIPTSDQTTTTYTPAKLTATAHGPQLIVQNQVAVSAVDRNLPSDICSQPESISAYSGLLMLTQNTIALPFR